MNINFLNVRIKSIARKNLLIVLLAYSSNLQAQLATSQTIASAWGDYVKTGINPDGNVQLQVSVAGQNSLWKGIFSVNSTNSYTVSRAWNNAKLISCSVYNSGTDDVQAMVMSTAPPYTYAATEVVLKLGLPANGVATITVVAIGQNATALSLSSNAIAPYSYVMASSSGTLNIWEENGKVGIGTLNPKSILDIVAPQDNDHIRISQETGHNESSLNYEYPALSYYAWTNNVLQDATSKISFYDRPGTYGYPNAVRTSDIYFQTAHNWNGSAYGQYLDNSLVIKATQDGGYVGIGTTTPLAKLDIRQPAINTAGLMIQTGGGQWSSGIAVSDINASSRVIGIGHSGNSLDIVGANAGAGGFTIKGASSQLNLATDNDNPISIRPNGVEALRVDGAGRVGIGTTNTNDVNYKLFVESGVRTRKVKVDQTSWPDYVFHSTYNLPPLKEVEEYIKLHQHLPNVVSATDVEKDGLDLGENQAALLKKIEELTLYVIEMKKEIEQQKAKTEAQEKELKALKKSM